jgi:hypothetical protein
VAVDAMVEFFYSHRYSIGSDHDRSNAIKRAWKIPEARCHVQVIVIADKYCLGDLHKLAKSNITKNLKPTKQHSDFHDVSKDVYKNTQPSNDLRKMIADYASKHTKKEFAADDNFGNPIVELPEFERDLARYLCDNHASLKSTHKMCPKHPRKRVCPGSSSLS